MRDSLESEKVQKLIHNNRSRRATAVKEEPFPLKVDVRKELLNSKAEESHFKQNFKPQDIGFQIDKPREFRMSSHLEKETVHHFRQMLRKNNFQK